MSRGSRRNYLFIMYIEEKALSTSDLLSFFGKILDELKDRKIIRSQNSPVGDYSEWLVAQVFNLELQTNSNKGFDALDSEGTKYQIKGRRLCSLNSSRQLGVIRGLEDRKFDVLVGVLFDRNFSLLEAYMIPHRIIAGHSKYNEHQNGHILHLKGKILQATGVKRIDAHLRKWTTSQKNRL